MSLLRCTILYKFRKKGQEKPGVARYTIPDSVYTVTTMIRNPTTRRVHPMVNPMAFVFTVNVV